MQFFANFFFQILDWYPSDAGTILWEILDTPLNRVVTDGIFFRRKEGPYEIHTRNYRKIKFVIKEWASLCHALLRFLLKDLELSA